MHLTRSAAPVCAILLLGAALSWLSDAYPVLMPDWAPWEFSWPEFLGAALALHWYLRGIWRTSPADRPSFWRRAAYVIGIVLMYAVTQTRFTDLALHLFAATQAQQFVLHDLGPFLIALAWPGAQLGQGVPAAVKRLAQSRPVQILLGWVQQPVIAAMLFIALLAGQVIPIVMFRVMLDWRLFDAMNIVMAVDGVLFWCLVLDPRPKPPAPVSFFTRVVLAFVVMVPVMPIGGFITFTARSLYGFYDICGRVPWLTPMQDQRMGGLILWIPGGLMSAIAVLLPINALRLAEDRQERARGKTYIQIGGRQIDPSAWTGR